MHTYIPLASRRAPRNSRRTAGRVSRSIRDMMATPKLCNAGDLPLDALYEILLRLPAKSLCRLRAVCRFWRSLLSDPAFAAAHAARRPREPPLIIAGHNCYSSEASFVNIIDLSGDIVKLVRLDGHRVMGMPGLNLACVRSIADGSCRLVDPAAASTTTNYYHVREGEHPIGCDTGKFLFGQVASTAEYKALRKVTASHVGEHGFLYEVCTLGGRRPRWRPVQGPPNTFGWAEGGSVAIDGLVYFLMADVYLGVRRRTPVIQQDWIYQFDLETEKWRPNIKGPQQGFFPDNNNIAAGDPNHRYREMHISLASLNGSLVVVHGPCPNMDIWFLMDADKGLWVKKYSIPIERSCSYFWPLVVLDDGRIVIATHERRSLQTLGIHDPRTNTVSVVANTSRSRAIGVYTGRLTELRAVATQKQ